ncbi:MAG: hypothetical protein AUG51_14415 [Acidobacteria bacterium 13_1_20CM_3_53_8]|nr:MAG: hypothetical protein AUG51_14415 [Acidobacteria bacterium 13_1_20CM_3_53_8]
MTQQSTGATRDIISDDLKLCGCSQHSHYSFPDSVVDYPRTQNQTNTSGGALSIEYPRLSIVSAEQVLVFCSEDEVVLTDVNVAGKTPYFASDGYLTELSGRKLQGSQILAALPVNISVLGETFKWPPVQREPFSQLPVDATNVDVGFARNSFDFGDGNSIVSVGAALPKLLLLNDGGAMFWVTSCQLITQGTGKFAGARGIQSFAGNSYFPVWPSLPEGQVGVLTRGFKAKIHRCIRVVLKESQVA